MKIVVDVCNLLCETVNMTTTREWIARCTGDASARQIAAALGLPNSTVHRWFREDATPAEAVVKIARLYNADPIDGLIAAELLEPGDAAGISSLTSLQLLSELQRREEELDVRPVAPRARAGSDSEMGGRERDRRSA